MSQAKFKEIVPLGVSAMDAEPFRDLKLNLFRDIALATENKDEETGEMLLEDIVHLLGASGVEEIRALKDQESIASCSFENDFEDALGS